DKAASPDFGTAGTAPLPEHQRPVLRRSGPGCPHRRRRTDTCPNQYKTAGFGQLSPPLTGHPPQDSRETAQIAKKHPQGEPSPVHFFLRSPPHPLAEEGLFVVPQLLLGLWHLAGLLE